MVQSLINTKENKNKSGKHLFTNSTKERTVAEGCERWLFVEVEWVPGAGLHVKEQGAGRCLHWLMTGNTQSRPCASGMCFQRMFEASAV